MVKKGRPIGPKGVRNLFTWSRVCSRGPDVLITTSAHRRLRAGDSWAASRASKSSRLHPRANARRRRTSRGASAKISLLHSLSQPASKSNGASKTPTSAPEAARKTIWATLARSIRPSGPNTSVPQRARSACSISGRCSTWWPAASASSTAAPNSASMRATVLLPLATPPRIPISCICSLRPTGNCFPLIGLLLLPRIFSPAQGPPGPHFPRILPPPQETVT